jgi:adenine/guanine phosphoribosyltransferase-like PRPP-binding protein
MRTAHISHDSQDIAQAIIESVAFLTTKKDTFDAILMPGDVSGVSVGVTLALTLQVPFAIGRVSEPKCWLHGSEAITDKSSRPGTRYLYIDDQISSGQTYRATVDNLRNTDPTARVVGTYQYQYGEFNPVV